MKIAPIVVAVGVLAGALTFQVRANEMVITDKVITWAVTHPELAEIFGHPFTAEGQAHRKKTFVAWTAEKFATDMLAVQPTVVHGLDGEIIAHAYGWIVRSTDEGRSWEGVSAVNLVTTVPEGMKYMQSRMSGCGVTKKGTILVQSCLQYNDGRKYEGLSDPSYRTVLYIHRSTDGGRTWHEPIRLNRGPTENAGGHSTRLFRLPGNRMGLAMGSFFQSDDGKPLPKAKRVEYLYIWTSEDDGQSWQRMSEPMCRHGAEPDVLVLPSGRYLAAVRYQRPKKASDPADLVSPHLMRGDKPPYTRSKALASGFVARVTTIIHSDDQGKTWSKPRFVTGFDEQTGCLVRLSDGTIILVFGYKTDTRGQRFMISYDDGQTWSRTVFALHEGGQYASSIVLKDDTILTVIHDGPKNRLHSLRWRAPSREQVSAGGFWRPRLAEPLGVPAGG